MQVDILNQWFLNIPYVFPERASTATRLLVFPHQNHMTPTTTHNIVVLCGKDVVSECC